MGKLCSEGATYKPASGFGAPKYPLAALYITILEYRCRRQLISRKLSSDRAVFAEKLEAQVEAAAQTDNQHAIFRSLHFYRCAKPTKRMRTGFVPLPSLQDKEGHQVYSFAQSRRTWQHHHAALEAGHVTTIAELYRHHVKCQNDAAQHLPDIKIANIPTPLDLEWSVRSLKNSALGLDTIPPEVWKIAPAITTRMLYPLLFKCAALAKVPFAVNGGVNHELYKGKGPT